MKEPVYQTLKQSTGQKQSTFDEARMLFEKMSGEIWQQAEIDRKETRHRRPLVKVLLALTLAACLSAVVTGIYGFYNFPDASIRQKADGVYIGKHGQPHTKEDFKRFSLWEKAMFISFGSVFVFGFSFGIMDGRERRKYRLMNKQTS